MGILKILVAICICLTQIDTDQFFDATLNLVPLVYQCQHCRTAFGSADIVVVKTYGQKTDMGKKVMKYHGNIHLGFNTKCLKQITLHLRRLLLQITHMIHCLILLEAKGVSFER